MATKIFSILGDMIDTDEKKACVMEELLGKSIYLTKASRKELTKFDNKLSDELEYKKKHFKKVMKSLDILTFKNECSSYRENIQGVVFDELVKTSSGYICDLELEKVCEKLRGCNLHLNKDVIETFYKSNDYTFQNIIKKIKKNKF